MTDTAPPPNTLEGVTEEFHTPLLVGEILRRARLQAAISINDVTRDLRFKSYVVEALEQSAYDKIQGGQVYVIGFVRSYADYLGLDGTKLVALLKQQNEVQASRPVYTFPKIARDRIAPPLWVIIGSGVALLFVLVLWSLMSLSSTNTDVPEVPKELTAQLTPPPKPKAPVIARNSQNVQSDTEIQPVNSPSNRIMIRAVNDAWVDVRNQAGDTVFSRVMKAGEDYWVPETGGVHSITAGNAGGIQIQKNGVMSAALGVNGQVIRNYKLQ